MAALDGDIIAAEEDLLPVALSVGSIVTALATVSGLYTVHDKDRSGYLSLDECVTLLNSPELRSSVHTLTNTTTPTHSKADIVAYFNKADTDRSGSLNRTEFLALFLAITTERVKKDPLLLAEALLGFLDSDRNGKLEGKELKVLMTILGMPATLLLPIPSFMSVDYRSFLETIRRSGQVKPLGSPRPGSSGKKK